MFFEIIFKNSEKLQVITWGFTSHLFIQSLLLKFNKTFEIFQINNTLGIYFKCFKQVLSLLFLLSPWFFCSRTVHKRICFWKDAWLSWKSSQEQNHRLQHVFCTVKEKLSQGCRQMKWLLKTFSFMLPTAICYNKQFHIMPFYPPTEIV